MGATKRRGQGEGSIYQRKSDGLWIAAVTLPGGKRKTVSARTQPEAITKRDEIKASIARGVLPDSATLSDWLDHWLDVIAPTTLKATTIDRHRSYVDRWIKPTIGAVKLQELQVDHVRLMMATMAKAKSSRSKAPLSVRTIIKARAVLQAALSQAEDDGRVLRNVASRAAPPKLKAEPKLSRLTTEQARKVIDATAGTRERARLAVALMAGLRQGEALALTWDRVTIADDGLSGAIDVAFSASRVRGQGMVIDTPKTLRSVRLVSLSPAAAQMVQAWRIESGGQGYVFPHRFTPGQVEDARRDYQEWIDALDRAEVPRVRLHDARGTAESHMASVVPDWVAAEMMGHEVTVGRRYYNRASPDQLTAAALGTDAIAGK